MRKMSDAELKEILGEYTAPKGLYQYRYPLAPSGFRE